MNIPVSLNSSNYGAFPDKGVVKIIVLIEFSPQSTVQGAGSREPGDGSQVLCMSMVAELLYYSVS
jgi:hypothetical protein